jgi:hypothetical protein
MGEQSEEEERMCVGGCTMGEQAEENLMEEVKE